MFKKLFRHREYAVIAEKAHPDEQGQSFWIRRSFGELLHFVGTLRIESLGREAEGYSPIEPHHNIWVFDVLPGSFAVVLAFHMSQTQQIVDAEIVQTLEEMDDLLCIHAADHFFSLPLDPALTRTNRRAIEDRVLMRYDQQVMRIVNRMGQLSSPAELCATLTDAPLQPSRGEFAVVEMPNGHQIQVLGDTDDR